MRFISIGNDGSFQQNDVLDADGILKNLYYHSDVISIEEFLGVLKTQQEIVLALDSLIEDGMLKAFDAEGNETKIPDDDLECARDGLKCVEFLRNRAKELGLL